jgi:DNA-binding transcriptional ArsR family regulator
MSQPSAGVARLARVLAHELCVRLLDELIAGEATVSDLATRLGASQPSVSSHLTLLREAGMIRAQQRGRQRVYSVAGEAPARALAGLRSLAVSASAPSPAGIEPADSPLRRARTCYDHLGGVAGVRALDELLSRRWLEARGRAFETTATGDRELERLGVDVAGARRARRAFAPGCPDWTERRFHLGGALGAAILTALVRSNLAQLHPGSRVVTMGDLPWPP